MARPNDVEIGRASYLLKRAQHMLRARMDAELRHLELTAPTYAVLAAVERAPGSSNAALARAAFVTPQTMQGMVAGLERAGLLLRAPDPEHGRVLKTVLTEQGRDRIGQAHAVAERIDERMTRDFGSNGRERLIAALEQCIANLVQDP